HELQHVRKLAVGGGFLDAVGGGGWGPVVTSSLIGQGNNPRKTIGTVNTAEFFVALATGTSFLLLGGIDHWIFVAGLIVGGLFAAPFAAFLTSKLSTRYLLVAVGLLISSLSGFNLYKALF
ncbi:MAG: TSUP family transporter, partial [Polynucleobacter victoriensis]